MRVKTCKRTDERKGDEEERILTGSVSPEGGAQVSGDTAKGKDGRERKTSRFKLEENVK